MAEPEEPKPAPAPDAIQRTSMAAERTWLAWWRTALAATAGSLGIGRLAPELLHVARAPYVVLGCGYGALAIALLVAGAWRQRALERAVAAGEQVPLSFALVAVFSIGGVLLAGMTVVLVLANA